MSSPIDVVAIDGPAGAGKSTVARRLARRLDWQYLDTGAMFRAVTLRCLELELGAETPDDALQAVVEDLGLAFDGDRVLLGSRDVSAAIRTKEIDSRVSVVAARGAVRAPLRDLQRSLGTSRPTVAEGRDMASVVFPDAAYKIWLNASIEERARRRYEDRVAAGDSTADYEAVLRDVKRRDEFDSSRELAPLQQVDGATAVDTTGLSIDEVVERLASLVQG